MVFSCRPFSTLVLVMAKMSSGKPCILVAPASRSGSTRPTCAGLKGGVVPAGTQRECVPEANVPQSQVTWALCRTSPPWRHGDPSPLAGSAWEPRTPCASPPLTCQLALIQVFHRIGLAEARHADVHPWGIGHLPRGSVVHHPAGTGQKVAEELYPQGMGWRSLGGSLDLGGSFQVLCGWGGGLVPSQHPCQSPSISGQEALMERAAAVPSPCGPGQGGSISSRC